MKILMVCLGNICRSPLAQGILESQLSAQSLDWSVDSAGTGAWHAGERPDARGMAKAAAEGIDISQQRARQFKALDFLNFDLILAMDTANYNDILKLAKTDSEKHKVHMIMNFAYPEENRAVPDPYYDGGFDKVFNMLTLACQGIIREFVTLL